jgi:hypothetical protein
LFLPSPRVAPPETAPKGADILEARQEGDDAQRYGPTTHR